MKKTTFLILLASIVVITFPAYAGKELSKIAVWDLAPRNTPASHAQELTSILVSEISKLGKYEVYSQENVRTLAGWTAERMKLGCTDTQCLIALGQMEIAKLISGSVGKIGNTYSISLNLFDTQNARAENAISEFCRSEDELISLVQQAVRKLLGVPIEPSIDEERRRLEGKQREFESERKRREEEERRIAMAKTPPKTLTNVFSPYTTDSNTMALWHFDEGSGMTAVDAGSHGNTGTLRGGATWATAGRFGKALRLDGRGYVVVPTSLNASSALTIEAWIHPRSYTSQWNAGIVGKWGEGRAGDDSYELALAPTGRVEFKISDGTGTEAGTPIVISNAVVPLNTWTHIAGTFTKGGSIKVYINGKLDTSAPAKNVNIQNTAQAVWIGQTEQGPLRGIRFNGLIDEVRISNVARDYIR